jgi:hypothetical protein
MTWLGKFPKHCGFCQADWMARIENPVQCPRCKRYLEGVRSSSASARTPGSSAPSQTQALECPK